MKRLPFLALTLFVLPACYAQDILTTRSGEDILTSIVEVGQTEIKYKKFENKEGPVYTIAKAEVLMIRYENGTKDIFEKDPTPVVTGPASGTASNGDMYLKGQRDAQLYYRGYKGAGTGTLVTAAALNWLFGLIPAIACSSTAPSDKNLDCPNPELLKDGYYRQGYVQQAHKTKRKKVWKNFWIGALISTTIIVAASQ